MEEGDIWPRVIAQVVITSYSIHYTKLYEVDLFYLAERLAGRAQPRPRLFQCCGREDFLYEDNLRFRDHCRHLGLELTYEEEAGAHEWAYWDAKIQRVLAWLPLES